MPITRPTLTKCAEIGVADGTSDLVNQGDGEVVARRRFRGLWSERTNYAKYFLGFVNINPGVRLERLTPQQHPKYPGLYATKIEVERAFQVDHGNAKTVYPADGTTGANFRKVEFTVVYEKPKFVVKDDASTPANQEFRRWVEVPTPQGGYDVLVCPTGSMKHLGIAGFTDPPIIPYGLPVNQPIAKLTFKWCDLPPTLQNTYAVGTFTNWQKRAFGDGTLPTLGTSPTRSYQGCVNKTPFFGYPAGSLLLDAVKVQLRPSPVDDPSWLVGVRYDVIFEMTYRSTPGGWNYAYFHDTDPASVNRSGYYFVARNGNTIYAPGSVPDNASMYCEREFGDLFNVT